jgi:intraflagellar transport protein 56
MCLHIRLEDGKTLLQTSWLCCRSEPTYVSWLARCLIMSGRAAAAWQLYQAAQDTGSPAAAGEEGYSLLQLIANDCYKMGAFYYALKVS